MKSRMITQQEIDLLPKRAGTFTARPSTPAELPRPYRRGTTQVLTYEGEQPGDEVTRYHYKGGVRRLVAETASGSVEITL